jgi:antitoxin component of RelBE/YafQ-DinJ toxin-antitoxin module
MLLFDKINQIIQERNLPFDKALPLITVDLNILAAEEDTDPAILLMLYIDNLKKR